MAEHRLDFLMDHHARVQLLSELLELSGVWKMVEEKQMRNFHSVRLLAKLIHGVTSVQAHPLGTINVSDRGDAGSR